MRTPVEPQRTLNSPIHCSGIGLHSGGTVSLALRPVGPDTGILFRRTDIDGREAVIPADWSNVVDSTMCTVLGNDHGDTVGTVEHLMAALWGCGIDNLIVDTYGPEVPIMDGSAEPFVFLIECAGVMEQPAARRAIRVLKQVKVGDLKRQAVLTPHPGVRVSFAIEFDSPAVARQETALSLSNGTFKQDIARARTFGFLEEVKRLKDMGLVRGGSLDNAVVVNGDEVLNEGGLRYEDEFVRHKVLDCIGDLYLAGAPIVGHFHGHCSGHKLNHRVLEALLTDDTAWCHTLLEPESLMPADYTPLAQDRAALA
ncbi:MAG: UDP-3-O-acyl-N-acetylglucosamine deacetylase [Kiloniellales bacterium]